MTVCGENPEHGCLPGFRSLGSLTGTVTLFNNTARRQPDKTKTLIYTFIFTLT